MKVQALCIAALLLAVGCSAQSRKLKDALVIQPSNGNGNGNGQVFFFLP
jgi:hypothetical protein